MPDEDRWGEEPPGEHRPNAGPNDLKQGEPRVWLPTGSPNKLLQRPPAVQTAANKPQAVGRASGLFPPHPRNPSQQLLGAKWESLR